MQNINLLSFFIHLAINIFFDVKKRLNINPVIRFGPRSFARYNAALSVILVTVVVGSNVYRFGTTVKHNYETGASRAQLISLLQNQKAAAQMITPPFKNAIPADKPIANPKNHPEINLAAVHYALDNTPPAADIGPDTAQKTESRDYLSTTIKKGGTLWQAVRQLLYEFMGDDPCAGIQNAPKADCRREMDKLINTQTQLYLRMNGLLSADGSKTLTVLPGAVVILDRHGNITLRH